MQYVTTITQKGQVTVPAPIRKALGLKPRDKVSFRLEDGAVRLEPARGSLLAGYRSVKLRGDPKDWKAIRKETQAWVAEQALKEM